MKLGSLDITDLKIGTTEINEVRLGSVLVWERGGGVDADAQAFLTAAGITDPIQQNAINQLVVDLKGYGLWTKMKALYPFVGGTASTHKWNLKNPLDTDAAFRLVFNGGWTHDNNGITGNGSNTYADTRLNGVTTLSTTDNSMSFYSRTNNSSAGVDCGTDIYTIQNYVGTLYYRMNSAIYTNLGTQDSSGHFVGTRRGTTDQELYRNGSSLNQNTITVDNFDNKNIYFGSWNNVLLPTNRNYAFASLGNGLNDTEASNFYTAVQAFQTSLSRNV